jgi:hypothetical protein
VPTAAHPPSNHAAAAPKAAATKSGIRHWDVTPTGDPGHQAIRLAVGS